MKSPIRLPILFVLFAACSPSDDLPPLAVQRDSAGITIIESFAPAWGDSAHWRVGVEPLVDLAESGTGDAHHFYSVRDVRRLPDGGVVVANRGSDEIRKFSPEGGFVRSDYMQIEELNASGDTVRILRIPDYPLALTAEEVRAERDARLGLPLQPRASPRPPFIVDAVEDMPSPETRPAYADMRVDPTGAIWLRPFRGMSEGSGPEPWLVLGPDGNWLGSVEIPENFRVTDIGVDEILGVWEDELDVQHPQVRRLDRG